MYFKMSKYSDHLESTHKCIGNIAKKTKEFIKGGRDLVFEEFHDANSVERLKRCIREGK